MVSTQRSPILPFKSLSWVNGLQTTGLMWQMTGDPETSPGSRNQIDPGLRSLASLLLGLTKQGNCSWNERGLVTDYSALHEEATVQTWSAAKAKWLTGGFTPACPEHGRL